MRRFGSPGNPDKDTVYDTEAATRHFTRDEFKEILIYANENGIKIVPEFDFPAHASAAIKSMEYRYYTSGDDKYSEGFSQVYLPQVPGKICKANED